MKNVHFKLVPMYLLVAFLLLSILFIFIAPIYMVGKIQEDAKKPKEEREFIYKGE